MQRKPNGGEFEDSEQKEAVKPRREPDGVRTSTGGIRWSRGEALLPQKQTVINRGKFLGKRRKESLGTFYILAPFSSEMQWMTVFPKIVEEKRAQSQKMNLLTTNHVTLSWEEWAVESQQWDDIFLYCHTRQGWRQEPAGLSTTRTGLEPWPQWSERQPTAEEQCRVRTRIGVRPSQEAVHPKKAGRSPGAQAEAGQVCRCSWDTAPRQFGSMLLSVEGQGTYLFASCK